MLTTLQAVWFALAALMVAIYVVMDGFDFGAGALHLLVARNDSERRQVLGAIGPFWDGNEVWLLAAGGVLFLAFPKVLGAGLSGFYLPIMMVLWVLILRGVSIELRSHLADAMWRQFWDGTFWMASTLAPILLGAALGNLVRGVPLSAEGWFSLPLFASWSPSGELGILDWYTVLIGMLALVALAHHGALFLVWKTEGPVRDRSVRAAGYLYMVVIALWLLATLATACVAPGVFDALAARPLAWVCTLLFLAGLVVSGVARRRGHDLLAFLGSGAFLLGLMAATAACVYPVMIGAVPDASLSLTAVNASASEGSLRAALWWWPVGLLIAVGYVALVFRLHRGKVTAGGY